MAFIFAYVTNPNKKTAKKIALQLLKKKLIACANIFPIDSVYLWKGKIEIEGEYVLIAKTKKESWIKVKNEIKKMHPYDVPCIIKIGVSANKGYEDWLKSVVK